jgi:hypothetical protein
MEPAASAVMAACPRFVWYGLGCALLLALASAAHADVLELDNGQRVTGDLKETTADKIVIEIQGRLVSYERARVRAIFLTPPSSGAAAEAPPPSPAEALAALKKLQASVSPQPPRALPAYSAQVNESRVPVEKYLKAAPVDSALQPAIADALALHAFAVKVWESRLQNSAPVSAEIGRNPIVDKCPALQRVVAKYPAPTTQENAWRRGTALEFELPAIWACAGEKVSEADAAAKPR